MASGYHPVQLADSDQHQPDKDEANDAKLPQNSLTEARNTSQPRNRKWWSRIGTVGCFIHAFGCIATIASCFMLLYIWRGAQLAVNHEQVPNFWQTIVFAGWAPSLVTITSAAIRTSMALQIGVVSAAAAAIMLESSSAALPDIAALSIERASRSGPFSILQASCRQRLGLPGMLRLLLVITAVIIALASTFISTILLSDFTATPIAGKPLTQTIGISANLTKAAGWSPAKPWVSKPAAHWRFAEAKASKPDSHPNIVDTGDTYRAMLPFTDATNRTTLEYYSGPAAVTNFRTLCMAPDFHDNNLAIQHGYNGTDASVPQRFRERFFSGSPSGNWTAFGGNEDFLGASNSTYLMSTHPSTLGYEGLLPLSLCGVSGYGSPGFLDPWIDSPYFFKTMLLLDSHTDMSNYPHRRNRTTLDREKLVTLDKSGPWTRIAARNGRVVLSASICYVNTNKPQMHNVTMSGSRIQNEPVVEWDPKNKKWNAEAVSLQLGGRSNRSNADRGILGLELVSKDNTTEKSLGFGGDNVFFKILSQLPQSAPSAWLIANLSYMEFDVDVLKDETNIPHPERGSIFQDIMLETQNPALALQAHVTRLYQSHYYDTQHNFDLRYPVTTVHSDEKLLPTRWAGLVAVIGLVAVHLFLVLATTIVFALQTKVSALGNSWQAVAQMMSPATREIVEVANDMTDKEIESLIKAEGLRQSVYGISWSMGNERMEVRRRRVSGWNRELRLLSGEAVEQH